MKIFSASKIFLLFCLFPFYINAQNFFSSGQIHGSFQLDAQYYMEDTLIGAPEVPEKVLMNAFANIIYTNGDFSAGLRFESFQNVMQGFDPRNKGNGIPYRFASYKSDELQVTIGNFYEQYGSGLILRAYQDWNLGIDNSIDGIQLQYKPLSGITLKGLIGNQRFFFDKGEGIIRGADGEFALNEIIKKWSEKKTKITLGGSVVSKYQKDMDPIYKYPENVAAFAGRLNFVCGKINLVSEYAYKINDPSAVNNNIYKPGEALYVSTTYSRKGLGVSVSGKRIDNMNFRSDRSMTGNPLIINYLPALTKQHLFTLASIYPYSTQPNGEIGFQGEVTYNIKKKTKLGGKWGTDISVNYSRALSINRTAVNDTTPIGESGTLGYQSDFFKTGDDVFYDDINIGITRRISKKLNVEILYAYQTYNAEVIEGHPGAPMVYAHIAALDVTYKIKDKKSLQAEIQHLQTRQDDGNWAMLMLQYTISPKWFFALVDMYNYGNETNEKKIHYYTASAGFIKNANRIALAYGKQREGILCVGGVCRNVPAANGITLSIISSF
ncbi:MAG: DUF6029 family protein [Bacteroidota bacterium]